jgi:chloramphenicol 3-O phosphotransferase
MKRRNRAGQIVILNGAPHSGKSSIVAAIQETFEDFWVNLVVDVARRMTPARLQPGIGLRPGEAGHHTAPFVPVLYAALYDSVAAHSRLGLNVAVDVGHYDATVLADAARRLNGLPVLFVGVRCPIEVILERRRAAEADQYVTSTEKSLYPRFSDGSARYTGTGPTISNSTRLNSARRSAPAQSRAGYETILWVPETRIDDGGGRSTHLLDGHAGGGDGRCTP